MSASPISPATPDPTKAGAGHADSSRADPSRADSRPAAQVTAAQTPGPSGMLTLSVGVVVVAALYLGRDVLVPITLAVLLSFLLAPLVSLLHRFYLGRVPAVLLSVVIALGVFLAMFGLLGTQLADLASQVPRYQSTIEKKVGAVQDFTAGRLDVILRRLTGQFAPAPAKPTASTPAATAAPAPVGTEAHPMPVEVHEPDPSPMAMAMRVISPVVGPLATTAIVLIFAIFVLLQREDLRDRMIRLVGSGDLHRTTVAMNDAARRLSRYFVTQLGVNVGFGLVIGVGLFAIGIPSAILWAVLGTLLRFVPYVGVPLSAIFPLALAAAVDPGWSMLVWTAILYFVVELAIGQALEPLLYGHSTGLSPFAVVVAATFWTWLWGPIGLILSTPLTLCMVVLGRHVDRLEFIDVLLGDRPALTPVESFYQRMLAGDADEAADQAELLLRDRSLSSYYDEVALPGLRLAANDATRGVLTPQQLERVRGAFANLVHDLDNHDDQDPAAAHEQIAPGDATSAERALARHPAPGRLAPEATDLPAAWTGRDPVLCVGGRGPLDEAVAAMLAQLLRKHRIGARVVGSEAVSRESIGTLDLDGVAMICVSYLDSGGNTSVLRFLVRRLRLRLPGVPVAVGLWGNVPDPAAAIGPAVAIPGADHIAHSLRQTVELCLEYVHGEREPAVVRTGPLPIPQPAQSSNATVATVVKAA